MNSTAERPGLEHYNTELEKAFRARSGAKAASLLKMRNNVALGAMEEYVTKGGRKVSPMPEPWDKLPDLVENRFAAAAALNAGNWVSAHKHLCTALNLCINALHKDDNWAVPVMHAMASDLRRISEQADEQLKYENKKAAALEEAERVLKKGFTITVNDRSPLEVSKKIGTLEMINQLFKIYFRLNNLRMCGNLIRTVNAQSGFQESFEQRYPISHRVTYKFFTGRLSLYEDRYDEAIADLSYAFQRIPARYKKNKRLALLYLIPAQIRKGILPKQELLEKYSIPQFKDITKAVRSGDMRLFDCAMQTYEEFFIKKALYLAVEKLRCLVYWSLCKRLHRMLQSHKIKLDYYIKCLRVCNVNLSREEVECIVANLIFDGYIKGYISHKLGYLVVSKNVPFPKIQSAS